MPAVALPDFLEPVLDYLSDVLPYPIYSFLISLMSHCLAFVTALFTLLSSLISTHPSNWDTQAILPPLITVLAAYLSLVAFYRTTSWLFRTAIWFIKWGTVIGALAAGAGWFAAQPHNGVGAYGTTALTKIGGVILEMLNQRNTNADAQAKSGGSGSKKATSQTSQKRPKSREPFELHRERRQRQEGQGTQETDARELMDNIVDAATEVLKQSGWWSLIGSLTWQADVQRDQPNSSSQKPKVGRSRSR
jgi:hypothetical protein